MNNDYLKARKAIFNEWLEKLMTFEETREKLDALELKYLEGEV